MSTIACQKQWTLTVGSPLPPYCLDLAALAAFNLLGFSALDTYNWDPAWTAWRETGAGNRVQQVPSGGGLGDWRASFANGAIYLKLAGSLTTPIGTYAYNSGGSMFVFILTFSTCPPPP